MNYLKFNYYVLFLCLLFFSRGALAGTAVAQIDHQDGELGEHFNLSITVAGDLAGRVELPPIADLIVAGTGTSTSISYINGSLSKETSYNFVLEPQKEGTFSVPALKLKIDDQWVETQAITIKVRNGGGGGSAAQQAPAGRQNPAAGRPGSASDDEPVQEGAGPNVFIEREFSKTSPYEGEPIVVTTKIFHRVELANVEAMNEKPAGVRIIEIKQGNTTELRNGMSYQVLLVKQAMIPTRSGKVKIPGFRVRAALVLPPERRQGRRGGSFDDFFDDFFNRSQNRVVRRVLASKDAELDVKAVPTQGKPANFKGLVGTFRIDSEISPAELKAGETATLTLTIDGVGALDTIGNLELPLGSKIRAYADKPQGEEHGSEKWGLESKRIFRFALVPIQKGDFALGQFKLPYFDPRSGKFDELVADLGELKVAEGDDRVASTPTVTNPNGTVKLKADVQALASDLIDIHRHIPLACSQVLSRKDFVLTGVLMGVPALLCLLVLILQSLKGRPRGGRIVRRRQALRNFQSSLEKLRAASLSPARFLESAFHAYREFIGDIFGLQGGSLTAKEIAPRLVKFRIPKDLLSQLEELVLKIEYTQYGSENLTQQQVASLVELMQDLAQEIEKRC